MTSCITLTETSISGHNLKPLRKVSAVLISSSPIQPTQVRLRLNTQLIPAHEPFNNFQARPAQRKLVVFRPKKSAQQKNIFMNSICDFWSFIRDFFILNVFPILMKSYEWVQAMVLMMVHAVDTVLGAVEVFVMSTIKEAVVLDFGKHGLLFNKFLRTCLFMKNNDQKNNQRTSNLKRREQQRRERKELTLVLDLDETLIHSSLVKPLGGDYHSLMVMKNNGTYRQVYMKKRPYLEEFLNKVSEEFNLIIFTASTMEYANIAIDLIDNNRAISRRFYRQSCSRTEQGWAKNLARIEPDLNKVVLIDNCNVAGSLQPDNHLLITSWKSDENDKCLLEYADFLLKCTQQWKVDTMEVKDMRTYIKDFKNKEENSSVEEIQNDR